VRKLFEERRGTRGPGWDRSYPLEPLTHIRRGKSLDRFLYTRKTEPAFEEPSLDTYQTQKTIEPTLNEQTFLYKRLPNIGGSSMATKTDRMPSKMVRPKPIAKKDPLPKKSGSADSASSVSSISQGMSNLRMIPTRKVEPSTDAKKTGSDPIPSRSKLRPLTASPKTTPSHASSTPSTPAANAAPDGRSSCKVCGRKFAEERLKLHESICKKTKSKKRKEFDITKHRLPEGHSVPKTTNRPKPSRPEPPKRDWRKAHEEFISNIRAAREAKAILAKGGKLSDLPPPPPSDTSHLIPCPHCKRKFNDSAAERHIPKCASILSNKPKSSSRNPPLKKK